MTDLPARERRLAESATTEQLRECIRDLVRLLALPSIWKGHEPREILAGLCEALESALTLEACYACARVRPSAPLACVLRVRGALLTADHPEWQGFVQAAGMPHGGPPSMIDNTPLGSLRMVSYDMGHFAEGSVCVASTEPDFPTQMQSLLLQAGVTLAATALESRRLVQEKEAASRGKDEFLAILGHELRNPLAPIVTALNLVKLRGEPPSREYQVIERQVEHLSRLVDNLQDVSRVSRGKVELTKQPVELAEVVAKAIEQAGPLLEQRRHFLRVEVPASGLLVEADSTRLAHVAANLLANAAQYTESGGNIAVTAWRDDQGIHLSVKDNGVGIEAQLLPRVFDLFLDSTGARERKARGLGIGLTLVKSLVQLHGGTVRAASEGPGLGSEFVVTLPALALVAPAADAEAQPRIEQPERTERVLVVDDSRDAAELVGEMLVAVGHEVSVAHDALQALSLIARVKPTVVVLDIGMPVMDGYELASRIRDAFREHPPRLIAVTGFGLDEDKKRSAEVGIETHLVKPVNSEQLLAAVRAPQRSPVS